MKQFQYLLGHAFSSTSILLKKKTRKHQIEHGVSYSKATLLFAPHSKYYAIRQQGVKGLANISLNLLL